MIPKLDNHSKLPEKVRNFLIAWLEAANLTDDVSFRALGEQMVLILYDGVWNNSPYRVGVANGLLLAAQTVLPLDASSELISLELEESTYLENTDGPSITTGDNSGGGNNPDSPSDGGQVGDGQG